MDAGRKVKSVPLDVSVNTAATPSPTSARHPPPHASVHELMASVFGEMSEESDSAVSDEGSDKDSFPTSACTLKPFHLTITTCFNM